VTAPHGDRVRVAQVIARLNIGGSAIQAITLTQRLGSLGYEALLIRGSEEPYEGSLDDLAEELGVRPLRIARMRREVGVRDLAAFVRLVRELRRFGPTSCTRTPPRRARSAASPRSCPAAGARASRCTRSTAIR